MRLAWFRAAPPDPAQPLDATAAIIEALRARHHLDVITAAEAHDFVWQHFRQPYDACVYETGASPAHAFMRGYLVHYPGIIAPQGLGTDALTPPAPRRAPSRGSLVLGTLDGDPRGVVARAVTRAARAGVAATLRSDPDPRVTLAEADAVAALEWPPQGTAPHAALLAMAAALPVIVLEVEATADWPALDPQTWRARGVIAGAEPIAISLDPRDEEHSLLLAIMRLAREPGLGGRLGAAGHAWWQAHATLAHAVRAWEALLRESAAAPTRSPAGARDGSARTRELLAPYGVTLDFLQA